MIKAKNGREVVLLSIYYLYIFIIIVGVKVSISNISIRNYTYGYCITCAIYLLWIVPIIISLVQNNTSFRKMGYLNANIIKQILIGIALCIVDISSFLLVDKNWVLSETIPSGKLLIEYLITLLCTGFSEELVFRGFIYSRLTLITGSEFIAVIISSILFGFIHFDPDFSNIPQILFAIFIGAFYGFSRYKIKNCSVLSLSIAHFLHDSMIAILSFIFVH